MFLLASKSANCLDLNLVFEKSINIKLVCDLIYLIFSLSKNSENFEIHFCYVALLFETQHLQQPTYLDMMQCY